MSAGSVAVAGLKGQTVAEAAAGMGLCGRPTIWVALQELSDKDPTKRVRPSAGQRLVRRAEQRAMLDEDGDGLTVTSPISVKNPAVFVVLDDPGWVDFGVGTVPKSLGLSSASGVTHVRTRRIESTTLAVLGQRIRARFGPLWVASPDAALPTSSGGRLANAREARGFSQESLADLLSSRGFLGAVTQDQASRMERDLETSIPLLTVGIDRVLEADGRLGYAVIGRGNSIRFPGYYVGPVWIHLTSTSRGRTTANVVWGPWTKSIEFEGEVVASLRCAIEQNGPLLVETTATVEAGTGWCPGAADINDNWRPASPRDRRALADEAEDLAISFFGRSRSAYAALIRRIGPNRHQSSPR